MERVVSNAGALTLVVAPSGYGKSELLAQSVEALERESARVVWLSLDPYGDDPTRYWAYLLAAVEPIVDAPLDDLRQHRRS